MTVKLVALYTPPENPDAFDKVYFETHLPLVRKIPNLMELSVTKFRKNVMGSICPYYMLAEMTFATPEDLKAAMASDEGQEAAQNLMSFATGRVTMMITDTVQTETLPLVSNICIV